MTSRNYAACEPPCSSSRCYGCNATARDLALEAKRAGQFMSALPAWAQSRVRRMAEQTAAAQAHGQAIADSREGAQAYRSYSSRMGSKDTTWICAGCEGEFDPTVEKFVYLQRRYCPPCALPHRATIAERDAGRVREQEEARVRLEIAERNARAERERVNARLAAESQAARELEVTPVRCEGTCEPSRPGENQAQCVMRAGHAGPHRRTRPMGSLPQRDSQGYEVQNARDARRGQESRAADALENAGASAELATRQIAQMGAPTVNAPDNTPALSRWELIEPIEPGEFEAREAQPKEEKPQPIRPIEID